MSSRKKICLWSFVVALGILLWGATGIAHNSLHEKQVQPEITASPDVKLSEPEPQITAAADAKLPQESKPEVTTEPAPPAPSAPDNIPFDAFTSTPQYTNPYVGPVAPYLPPFTGPQYPLPAPQQPPVGPILPVPVQPLPPVVTGPVEGLLEPLRPITDPLLGTVKDVLPPLPSLPKVDIHVGLHP